MNITILNGNPSPQNQRFDAYLDELNASWVSQGHQVTALELRAMKIRYCTGCWNCWVKTPGQCSSNDQSLDVCRAVIHSDFTLWASPIIMGFPSALLKKVTDKLIPLVHPYVVVDQGEAHHLARYDHYPRFGLLLEKNADCDDEDLAIIEHIFSRTALNIKSELAFSTLAYTPIPEVSNALNAITQPMGNKWPSPEMSTIQTHTFHAGNSGSRRLTVFNGSPRGKKSNSRLLIEQFVRGFGETEGNSFEVHYLNRVKDSEAFQNAFAEAECVLLATPLYTDAMPGVVKAFIETLQPFVGWQGNPPMGFIVQSGFPEAAHSRPLERYFKKFATRMGSPYLGTIVKGGVEGIQIQPEKMTQKLFESFYQIGLHFGQTGEFDQTLIQELAKPEHYPRWSIPLMKLFLKTGMGKYYWNMQLKQNEAYEERFARPFA